jgi:hypothetical protein
MRRPIRILILAMFFTGLSGLAALQGESIFIKAVAGGGYTMVNQTFQDSKLNLSGISGIGMLQVGGALTKSAKLYGFTGISTVFGPKATTENLKIDTEYSTMTIWDFGLGLGYYLADGKFISLGGSVAQNYVKYTVYGTEAALYTRHGWGAHLMLGQEFALSNRLSVGVSAIGYYGRVYDVGPSADAPVNNIYFGLAGSLMYD